ncbi:ATP-binding cassette domain-containing protein [Streptomyces mobaraensis]|uniref:ATP-binding cassette domain-containing protein n=1 Tax=Streptomyces mobaraensis TaxID=35621 RepID=UPI001FA724F1|nr:ATP-binding cassette domain-containing protein [Streptomyces mobaraensis]
MPEPRPGRTPSTARQGLRFLAARRAALARLAGWSVLEAGHTFALGFALARALDRGFLAGRAATGLGWLGLAALAVLAGAYGTGRTYRATADLVEPLRDGLVRRVVGRALGDGDGAAVSRLTHQVEIARDTFAGLVMVSRSFVFTAGGALAGLCALAPALLLAVVPPLLLGLLLFLVTLRVLARRQEAVLVADEALARSLGDVARGLRDITAGGAERRVAAATGALVDAERDAARALARWSLVRVAALTLAGRLPVILLLVLAPWLLDHGTTPGAFVGALAYVTQSLLPAVQELVHGLGASGARLAVVIRRLTAGPSGEALPRLQPAPGASPAAAANEPPAPVATHGPAPAPRATTPAPTATAARQGPGHAVRAEGTTATTRRAPDRTGNRRPAGIRRGPAQASANAARQGPGPVSQPDGPASATSPEPAAKAARQGPGHIPGAAGTAAGARPAPAADNAPDHGGDRPPAGGPYDPDAPRAKAVPRTRGRPPQPGDTTAATPAGPATEAPSAHRPGPAGPAHRAPSTPTPALAFRGVTFAYGPHAAPVVHSLDLVIPPGTRLAVVGPSGIGKSTLTGLAAGLPARDAAARAGRVLIPQEAYVFSGTLAENLGYFRPDPVPEDELWAAVRAVGMAGLAERLGGLGADVAPAGLSAGERQWIALARAYLSPAPLALLDEATCHLDPAAEARAEDAFARRPGGTLVVVAHRAASALRADRVLVMDGPHTVCGDHAELLRASPLYRDLMADAAAGGPSDPAGSLGDPYGVHPVARTGLPGDGAHVVAHGAMRQVQAAGDLPDAGALGGE